MGAGGCGADAPPRRGQGRWVKGGQVSGGRLGGSRGPLTHTRWRTEGGVVRKEFKGLRQDRKLRELGGMRGCGPRGLAGSHPRGATGSGSLWTRAWAGGPREWGGSVPRRPLLPRPLAAGLVPQPGRPFCPCPERVAGGGWGEGPPPPPPPRVGPSGAPRPLLGTRWTGPGCIRSGRWGPWSEGAQGHATPVPNPGPSGGFRLLGCRVPREQTSSVAVALPAEVTRTRPSVCARADTHACSFAASFLVGPVLFPADSSAARRY